MDTQIATAIISGIFSIISAFGAIFLKDYLDKKKEKVKPNPVNPLIATESQELNVKEKSSSKYSYKQPLGILFLAFGIGIISRLLRPVADFNGTHFETLVALILLIIIAIFLLIQKWKRKEEQSGLFFQLEMITLWSGFLFGWSLIEGKFWSDLVALSVLWWLGCAVIGGIIFSFFQKRNN